jgi:hypothetical protein
MIEDLLISAAQLSPVIGILIAVVWYLKNQVKEKEETNNKLNVVIMDCNKENLEILYKVLSFFEKFEDTDKIQHAALLAEIGKMRSVIEIRLEKLDRNDK